MSKQKTRRVQLELTAKSMSRLEEVKKKTEASSYADVIRSSMMAYSWLIELHDNGEKVFIEDSSGKMREVEIFNPF